MSYGLNVLVRSHVAITTDCQMQEAVNMWLMLCTDSELQHQLLQMDGKTFFGLFNGGHCTV